MLYPHIFLQRTWGILLLKILHFWSILPSHTTFFWRWRGRGNIYILRNWLESSDALSSSPSGKKPIFQHSMKVGRGNPIFSCSSSPAPPSFREVPLALPQPWQGRRRDRKTNPTADWCLPSSQGRAVSPQPGRRWGSQEGRQPPFTMTKDRKGGNSPPGG